jgi:uncharacterized protein (DUF427 family)
MTLARGNRTGRWLVGSVMATATWNGVVIAESIDTVIVEGNHYFPRESLTAEVTESAKTTVCPWKGTANYLNLVVDGAENPDSIWFYAVPKEGAKEIAGRVAFWKGITVQS